MRSSAPFEQWPKKGVPPNPRAAGDFTRTLPKAIAQCGADPRRRWAKGMLHHWNTRCRSVNGDDQTLRDGPAAIDLHCCHPAFVSERAHCSYAAGS